MMNVVVIVFHDGGSLKWWRLLHVEFFCCWVEEDSMKRMNKMVLYPVR